MKWTLSKIDGLKGTSATSVAYYVMDGKRTVAACFEREGSPEAARAEGDFRLMTAAPDMLDALKRIAAPRPLGGELNLSDNDMQRIAREAVDAIEPPHPCPWCGKGYLRPIPVGGPHTCDWCGWSQE